VTATSRSVRRTAWRDGSASDGTRAIAEETPVAFSYDGSTYAVMMATPADLEDFAIGLTLTEGIVAAPGEIEMLEIVEHPAGIDLSMRLATPRAAALKVRRRAMAGPVGCGLCGIESLEEAVRSVPTVAAQTTVSPADIRAAIAAVSAGQALNRETRAVHAAGFWRAGSEAIVREDVGRHNALDKLAGALARQEVAAADGIVVLTSRLSVELVQKAAMIDAPLLVAISAPTALAVHTAEAAGITLVAIARDDGFEVFTHTARVVPAMESADAG
jgi:FdhD protein